MALRNSKVYVAGHRGMVGSAICRRLSTIGVDQIITATSSELDLRRQELTEAFIEHHSPDIIIISAAKVGGIYANDTYPADFLYDNLMIAANLIHAAYKNNVKRVLFLGSSCIYPKFAEQPIDESSLLSSSLESTNEAYALAKISGLKLCEYYRKQHGCLYHSAMPCNLYGVGDNYHPENSHVIPALIRRFDEAVENNAESVSIWGTGKPLREFLFADDLADACLHLLELENPPSLVNVGAGSDISIHDLAKLVAQTVGFKGQIITDPSKPDGTPKKLINSSLINSLGWRATTPLKAGLKFAYDDYRSNQKHRNKSQTITPSHKRMKIALITGITGQDGSYLAEQLLEKGYEVHGMIRRSSSFNTERIDHLYHDAQLNDEKRFHLHHGDLTDSSNLNRILERVGPDEIYNLGAQSHVKVSFEVPEYTAEVDAMGTLRFLDAIKEVGLGKQARFYQASTSELYGEVQQVPQTETTPFYPRSPYGVAKLYGYWIVVNYRESYGLHASNGILFNHESPRRGETFVTRKITRAAGRIKLGLQPKLYLGNLDAQRDWGYAPEYTEMMWRILQQDEPSDYVCATGEMHTVREFCQHAFDHVDMPLDFVGEGVNEKGICRSTGRTVIEVSPDYFRPAEVEQLLGDSSKAKRILDWTPKVTFKELVKVMAEADLQLARREVTIAV